MTKEKPIPDLHRFRRVKGSSRDPRLDPDLIAAQALAFIAGDPDRLADFLGLTGLDPRSLRDAAGQPGFSRGVLAHVMGDEALLLAFAAHADVSPEAVAASARAAMGEDGGGP